MKIKNLLEAQRNYFEQGNTLQVSSREKALKALRSNIRQMEDEILHALSQDLGKSGFEGYMAEVGMVLEEITYMLKHVRKFTGSKRVRTPLAQFWARSYMQPCPYGTVLIMSPWNYPFLLAMGPLIDALTAGNTIVLKPSNYSPATSNVMDTLIQKTLPPELVKVVLGGREANAELLEEKFDYIFFTGSKQVGRLVMEKAAKHLTPISLELGGKSPCIVDKTADIKIAARRIVFGKYLNLGQTCVAPDYLLVQREIKDELLRGIKKEIHRQFGSNSLEDADYGNIINEKHFERLKGLMEGEETFVGGGSNDKRCIEPTVLTNVSADSPVMQEEIFGPILPVIEFDTLSQVTEMVRRHPTPLAFYLFTGDGAVKEKLTKEIAFGGGCINDTIIHLATTHMGFGGVGESGMGSYHGKTGFDTFTHYKSIVDKKTIIDLPFRYRPYTEGNLKMIRRFMK